MRIYSFSCVLIWFVVPYIWFYLALYLMCGRYQVMAFIKVQKLVVNDDGSIRSGSASIMTTEYDSSYKEIPVTLLVKSSERLFLSVLTGKKVYSFPRLVVSSPMIRQLIPLRVLNGMIQG